VDLSKRLPKALGRAGAGPTDPVGGSRRDTSYCRPGHRPRPPVLARADAGSPSAPPYHSADIRRSRRAPGSRPRRPGPAVSVSV